MTETQVTSLQTTLLGYIGQTSTLVVAVGLAVIGVSFAVALLRKGRRAASGKI
jgi:hypothetical protein